MKLVPLNPFCKALIELEQLMQVRDRLEQERGKYGSNRFRDRSLKEVNAWIEGREIELARITKFMGDT